MQPAFDMLGWIFNRHSNGNVLIAKIDATENDAPIEFGNHVDVYPTLLFKMAGASSPEVYRGDRSFDAMSHFVLTECKKGGLDKAIVSRLEEDIDEVVMD